MRYQYGGATGSCRMYAALRNLWFTRLINGTHITILRVGGLIRAHGAPRNPKLANCPLGLRGRPDVDVCLLCSSTLWLHPFFLLQLGYMSIGVAVPSAASRAFGKSNVYARMNSARAHILRSESCWTCAVQACGVGTAILSKGFRVAIGSCT